MRQDNKVNIDKDYALFMAARFKMQKAAISLINEGATIKSYPESVGDDHGARKEDYKWEPYKKTYDYLSPKIFPEPGYIGKGSWQPFSTTANALQYALFFRQPELAAYCIKTGYKPNKSEIAYAASIGENYLFALTHHSQAIQQFKANALRDHRKLVANNRYKTATLAELQFAHLGVTHPVNQVIALAKVQADRLLNGKSLFSVGKGAKAKRIIEQLYALKSDLEQESNVTAREILHLSTEQGSSLTDILKERRYYNPFVMFGAHSYTTIKDKLDRLMLVRPKRSKPKTEASAPPPYNPENNQAVLGI